MTHLANTETFEKLFFTRTFLLTLLVNAVWINASEIFRYFVFVMPMMQEAFPQVTNIAPMNLPVFMIWGIWDTILLFAVTGFSWLYLQYFGQSIENALKAATLLWLAIFVILWLGLFNMNLATLQILMVTLPLAWFELVIATLIVKWGMIRFSK